MIPLCYFLLVGAFGYFAFRRAQVFLHIFQQEGYDNARFARWWWQRKAFDRRGTIAILAVGTIGLVIDTFLMPSDVWILALLALLLAAILYVLALKEPNPAHAGKKPLVFTARAKRILAIGWLLIFAAAPWAVAYYPWPLLLLVQLIPLLLIAANILLAPFEALIQHHYLKRAKAKLESIEPVILGITGSYGKTSVKHILAHLLGGQVPTAFTTGGVNTVMGITRFILNDLKPAHRFFIIEMGAYGIGSIDTLCKAFPPKWGIVTAIGPMHLERFGSIDNVAQAKSELAAHALANGGEAILAQQVMTFTPFQKLATDNPGRCTQVGEGDMVFVRLIRASNTSAGLAIEFSVAKQVYNVVTPLYGLHQAANILLAIATCLRLGYAMDALLPHLKTLPQIRHRQEVKRDANGVTIIDDAYNSNPSGFKQAMELLDTLVQPSGRRILVTPGIVELGDIHDATHHELGVGAARHADICIPVLPDRIPTFIEGFRSQAKSQQMLIPMPNFAETQQWLNANMRAGDVILLENDLPDLYEARLTL